jgi:glycosyltransferase involved in cell wall biosynthesis
MACGVPVVTSNTSSMPEIAGDAALFSDPYNATDIAEKIYLLETNKEIRDTLIDRGYIRSSLFSWLNMAKEYNKLYLKQQ